MRNFTTALMQCRPSSTGSLSGNLELMDILLGKASTNKADLAVFPEVSLSGYVTLSRQIPARSFSRNDKILSDAVALTGKHSISCIFGFFERDGDNIYNTCALADAGRLIGFYRKVHIPPRETGLITPGSEFKVFELPFARIGISICFDNEFPESHTCLALMGAEVIIMPAGWAQHWEKEDYIEPCSSDDEVIRERRRWMHMMFGARCRDTGTYSLLVNQSGIESDGPWRFVGKSMAFSPTGHVIAEARAWGSEILYVELNADLLEKYRSMDAYILKSRRPSAYKPITRTI